MAIRQLKPQGVLVLLILTGLWLPPSALSANECLISSVARDYANGSDVCILKAIAKKLNLRLEIKFSPFKRRLCLMEDGDLDLLTGLLKSPERERYIHYLDPPYKRRSDTVFFVTRGRTALICKYEDLHQVKIGIVTGSKYFPRFDHDTRLHLEACANAECNFKKLIAGRIDAAAFPESVGIDLVDGMGIKDHVVAADYRFVGEKNVYIGISKKSRLMDSLQTIEKAIRSMIESGKIKQVIVKHYTDRGLPVPAM